LPILPGEVYAVHQKGPFIQDPQVVEILDGGAPGRLPAGNPLAQFFEKIPTSAGSRLQKLDLVFMFRHMDGK